MLTYLFWLHSGPHLLTNMNTAQPALDLKKLLHPYKIIGNNYSSTPFSQTGMEN